MLVTTTATMAPLPAALPLQDKTCCDVPLLHLSAPTPPPPHSNESSNKAKCAAVLFSCRVLAIRCGVSDRSWAGTRRAEHRRRDGRDHWLPDLPRPGLRPVADPSLAPPARQDGRDCRHPASSVPTLETQSQPAARRPPHCHTGSRRRWRELFFL
jgi:hypothetical protein